MAVSPHGAVPRNSASHKFHDQVPIWPPRKPRAMRFAPPLEFSTSSGLSLQELRYCATPSPLLSPSPELIQCLSKCRRGNIVSLIIVRLLFAYSWVRRISRGKIRKLVSSVERYRPRTIRRKIGRKVASTLVAFLSRFNDRCFRRRSLPHSFRDTGPPKRDFATFDSATLKLSSSGTT